METKGKSDFLNALMTAWVAGWYRGLDDIRNDDRKKIDCPEILSRYPMQAAAPDLLEACEKALLCILQSENVAYQEEIKDDLNRAIARAKGEL